LGWARIASSLPIAEWRRRLVFLWNYGAGGVNYYPLRNVFIRHSDVDGDRVVSNAGPVPPPRTLAYFAAHEVGHSLIGERVGALANHRLPALDPRRTCGLHRFRRRGSTSMR